VAAPRKYTDAQRAAVWALYQRGVRPASIAARCKAGLASVEPFDIPRRTVSDICSKMALERTGSSRPENVAEAAHADALANFPSAALKVLEEEAATLAAKQASGKALSLRDVEKLALVAETRLKLEQRLEKQRGTLKPAPALKPEPRNSELAERLERLHRDGPAPTDGASIPADQEDATQAEARAVLDRHPEVVAAGNGSPSR